MRLSGELCTGLFIFMNQRFFPETAVILFYSNSVLCPIHKKALGTIELWRRRLINSTFAGWAILGAYCRIINIAKWPQSRETNMLSSFKKGRRKTWEQNTPLLSKAWQSWCSVGQSHWVSKSVQGSELCWVCAVLWSPLPLLSPKSELLQPASVTWLTSHHTPWQFSSIWS